MAEVRAIKRPEANIISLKDMEEELTKVNGAKKVGVSNDQDLSEKDKRQIL